MSEKITVNELDYKSPEVASEFEYNLRYRIQLMLESIMDLQVADRQLVIEQMPQLYKDKKHLLGVLDSELDNMLCSNGSYLIRKSDYYQKSAEKLEALELEIAAMMNVYQQLTGGRNIEETDVALSMEK